MTTDFKMLLKQVIIALLIFPSISLSQITITDADLPDAGNVFINTNALVDLTLDVNETGANSSWDYSNMIPLYSLGDTFIDAGDLPLVYLLFFFNSTLAEKNGLGVSLDQFTFEDVYTIYKKTSSVYQVDGYGGTLDGLTIPIAYSTKDVLYRFPINYGNEDSSDASIVLDIPGLAYFSQNRHRVNEVDGWGNIKTPSGSFDALRVKSTITDVDSVYIDTLASGYSTQLKSYEYKWLAKDEGTPVFQINAQDVLGYQVITQIIYRDTAFQTGINELMNSGNEFEITPNPAGDFVNLYFGNETGYIEIFTALGQKIEFQKIHSGKNSFSVSDWQNGMYFIKVNSGSKSTLRKFIVQHN